MNKNVIVILLISTCLTACPSKGGGSIIGSKSSDDVAITAFEVDGSTVKMKYRSNIVASEKSRVAENENQQLQEEIVNTNEDHLRTSIGKVTLNGEDNSTSYEIDGDNIKYNGKTFYNLASVANKISTPYSKSTFINWVLKCVNYTANDIVISYDSRTESHEDDYMNFDELISFDGAVSNTSKFDWLLEIHNGTQVISFVGNSSEIYTVGGTAIEVDMTQYVTNDEKTKDEVEQEETTDEASEENSSN